jgi:hypothetical protein
LDVTDGNIPILGPKNLLIMEDGERGACSPRPTKLLYIPLRGVLSYSDERILESTNGGIGKDDPGRRSGQGVPRSICGGVVEKWTAR